MTKFHAKLFFATLAVFMFVACGPDVETKYFSKKKAQVRSEYLMTETEDGQRLRHGAFTEYHRSGEVAKKGSYDMGKKDGKIEEFYDGGEKRRVSTFKKGVPEGVMTFWHKNGKKGEVISYKLGKKDGREARWNSSGQLLREVNWKAGLQHGQEKEWDSKGNLKFTIPWEDGKKNGKELIYCQDELSENVFHEKNWKEGVMHGDETYWDCEHGIRKQSQAHYVDGKLDGRYVAWITYGAKVGAIDTVVNYKDGIGQK